MRKFMHHFVILLLIAFQIFFSVGSGWQIGKAQTSYYWTKPRLIPFYDDKYPPYIVADQNLSVHAFNSLSLSTSQDVILYRRWTYDTGWSVPVDILLFNSQEPQALQGVFLDKKDRFHIIYQSGSRDNSEISYVRATASAADQTSTWSEPVTIGKNANSPGSATIVGDGENFLIVLYTGMNKGLGVYDIHSLDGGVTWSEPRLIQLVDDQTNFPFHIRAIIDDHGVIHATWSWMNENGLGEKIYYSKLGLDMAVWSNPNEIAARDEGDYAADWASIIQYQDELIIMYMDGIMPGGIPPTRWMRRSKDRGDTWMDPIAPFPQVGEHGFAEMLIDSSQTLHIILANRVGFPAISGVWHGTWEGDLWGALELLPSGVSLDQTDPSIDPAFDMASRPNAVISQGNVILVTWWHDMQDPPNASYSYINLETPELPVVPLVSPTTSDPTAEVNEQSPSPPYAPSPTNETEKIDSPIAPIGSENISDTIIISILTAFLVIVGVVAYQIISVNRIR